MKEIKNIDKKSLAKIIALIYGLVGFLTALTVAAFTVFSILTNENFQGSSILVVLYNFGVGLLLGIISALLTASIGWVIGYLTAGLYNWFAGKVGGVKIELADTDKEQKE